MLSSYLFNTSSLRNHLQLPNFSEHSWESNGKCLKSMIQEATRVTLGKTWLNHECYKLERMEILKYLCSRFILKLSLLFVPCFDLNIQLLVQQFFPGLKKLEFAQLHWPCGDELYDWKLTSMFHAHITIMALNILNSKISWAKLNHFTFQLTLYCIWYLHWAECAQSYEFLHLAWPCSFHVRYNRKDPEPKCCRSHLHLWWMYCWASLPGVNLSIIAENNCTL